MNVYTVTAPAKINLCLLLGGPRADGRHELVTLFQSVGLADTLTVSVAADGEDAVRCDDVAGPNLVADALTALRAVGWDAPPLQIRIDKRIPIAAGMGGGSADAAALLRLAPQLAAVSGDAVQAVAAELGADVPGQLTPGVSLGTAAGERIADAPAPDPHALLVVPQSFGLSTADVYRESDRLGLGRSADELRDAAEAIAAGDHGRWLGVNDLQAAALSLAPQIGSALDAVRDAGAAQALVCGSGPTVIGLFPDPGGTERASEAMDALRGRWPRAVAVRPV